MRERFRLVVVNSHPIQYFAPLYRRLAQHDAINVHVLYCSRQGVDPRSLDPGFGRRVIWDTPLLDGYSYEFVGNLLGDRGVRGFFSLVNLGIIGRLASGRYDALLVHGHQFFTYVLAILVAKAVGTRVFLRTETTLLIEPTGLRAILRRAVVALYRRCDAFLYIGSKNREFYESIGIPRERLFPAPYTVDNELFSAAAGPDASTRPTLHEELGLDKEVPIILYASKLTPRKRALDLLKAYEAVRRLGIRGALAFIGDGSERAALEEHARAYDVEDVFFLGFKNQSELPNYYAQADLFVLPSEREPWGLVVNEAMCAGTPVITTTDVGASYDLVTSGETGFVYEAGDVSALERLLARCLGDREICQRMSENCIARMKHWSYRECVDGVLAALASAG